MARTLTATRLPGIRFEVVPPPRSDFLPRMDIALFAGFAASGPLNVPVPLEDFAHFEAIFGGDLALAWDQQRGEQVYAYLAPAVRAFFRNGGQRCWVVRVADGRKAYTAHFHIPGLVSFDGAEYAPAFASARSAGHWAESLRVSDALLSTPLTVTGFNKAQSTLDLLLAKPASVIPGDVLRLTFDTDGYLALGAVVSLESLESNVDVAMARKVRAKLSSVTWLKPAYKLKPAGTDAVITAYTHKSGLASLNAKLPDLSKFPENSEQEINLDFTGILSDEWWTASEPGCTLKAKFPEGEMWLLVTEQTAGDDDTNLPGGTVRFSGKGIWRVDAPVAPLPIPDFAEKLTFELWSKKGNSDIYRLNNLGFAPGQPRFWGALPDDETLFTTHANAATGDASFADGLANPGYAASKDLFADSPYPDLWKSAHSPRFPLAGAGGLVTLPFLMGALTAPFAGPDEPDGDPLERDGLAEFSAALFLDPELASAGTEALIGLADDIRYMRPVPRRLRGIHAALSVDEATIIAVPDAVQRGWYKPEVLAGPDAPDFEKSLLRPEWWHFAPCRPLTEMKPVPEPDWGEFLRCGIRIIPAPDLSVTVPDSSNSFTLTWTEVDTDAVYILEESAFPDFSSAVVLYRGIENRYDIFGYAEGDYYYRVRAEITNDDGIVESSDWSDGVVVRISSLTGWQLAPAGVAVETLNAIQRCVLRLCAARGDVFAVLSLPGYLREKEATDFSLALQSPIAPAISVTVPDLDNPGMTEIVSIAAIGYGEARALQFGALYHPWVFDGSDTGGTTRLCPPDGFSAGILARRAFERGAWVAPANELMRGVVATSPILSADRLLDFETANLNIIRREPTGFMCLSELTLSDDPDWTLINVRRLISLLRRLAQLYGSTYVFEPNDDAFARLVKRTFEGFMRQMFARGAFSGRVPETSYQVSVNVSEQDRDAGRFIVELRVAPSLPMRFITVRLIQSGERSLVTEGG